MFHKFKPAIIALTSAIIALGLVFLLSTVVWIAITGFVWDSFFSILSNILKKGGSYSTLLTAIVVAVAFQSYKDAENKCKESEDKIKEIGQYTIAFQREEVEIREKTYGDIMAIEEETDFALKDPRDEIKEVISFAVKFLTSGKESTNLQCIMVFEDSYFSENKKKIIQNYYGFLQRTYLQNPLYLAARQTNPELKCENRNRYVNMFIRKPINDEYKSIWFSAITDQGVLLFIKVKLRLTEKDIGQQKNYFCQLINQLSYSVENGDIKALYY
jgi:hypothetical protein